LGPGKSSLAIQADLRTFFDLMSRHSYDAQRRDELLFMSFAQNYWALND
jgi:hypothetical protein